MTFRKRLLIARDRGDMTTADLKHWFDRPYPTVRYWLFGASDDFEPSGPRGRLARERLVELEWAIAHNLGFPIPAELSVDDRPQHVKKIRHVIHADLLEKDIAARAQVRGDLQGG